MKLINYRKIVSLLIIIITATTFTCWSSNFFAPNSKLSNGKWIKIKLVNEGVYEITHDELRNFGFSDPTKVKVFGKGGNTLPEFLNMANFVDDIEQVPIIRANNKICFFANGVMNATVQGATTGIPRYFPIVNPYSSYSYYFLTDNDYPELLVEYKDIYSNGYYSRQTSVNYAYHEKDECSIGGTGKVFLGEDFTSERDITIDLKLLNPVENEQYVVSHSIVANANAGSVVTTRLNGELVPFSKDNSTIRGAESEYVYYNYVTPFLTFKPETTKSDIAMNYKIESTGNIKIAKIDYIIITYQQKNILSSNLSQLRINQLNSSAFDILKVTDDEAGAIILNVDNPQKPIQYKTKTIEVLDKYETSCTPGIKSSFSKYIAFNPNRTLNKVEFAEELNNQNLHAMAVPDMLIITTKDFISEAQRIADYHKAENNLDVAIVDHTKIFNEFSSGTPDASAYRLISKMLWERDSKKFKYLLLFGGGSYDNRRLIGKKGDNYLLTYQSDVSNNENRSYTTDDFFTFLEDFTGDNHPLDKMKISVGRMPVLSIDEAKNAVDKLLQYVNSDSPQSWKNNILIIADQKDSGLHMFQAEGVETLINQKLDNSVHINKVYAEAYPLNSGLAAAARTKMSSFLSQGQLLVSYIGHGGPRFLTKQIQLWRKEDVKNTPIPNLPFFSLATCDVARFDSDMRGIAEDMFHQNGGGAIACMASCRSVNASDNDILNRSFIQNLFTLDANDEYPTIGNALKNAKLSFQSANSNKLSFFLLGDPAMRLKYPKTQLKINTINGVSAIDAKIYPMSENTITGEVYKKDGTIDTDFNGTVYATLYDKSTYFASYTMGYPTETRDIYFQQDILSQTSGTVVNGVYNITLVTPKNCFANNENVSLRLFAENNGTQDIVNASEINLEMKSFDESHSILDNIPPTITSMYLNDETFQEGDIVESNSTLYIKITDNIGINTKSIAIGQGMDITLDRKKSYPEIANHFKLLEDGKSGYIEFDLKDMASGQHSLTFSVSDLANNITTHSISFQVQPLEIIGSLDVEEVPARNKATFVFSHNSISESPEVAITITNDKGEKVWGKTTSIFPCEWDLTDTQGKRVTEGTYNFSGIISAGKQFGNTIVKKIIVVKQ